MKKQIQLSLLAITIWGSTANASWFIKGKEVLNEYPLATSIRSVDNGGTKSLIEASSDGTGVIINGSGIANNQFEPDNSAYNSLVFKYAQDAEDSGLGLADYIIQRNITNPDTISEKDVDNATQIKQNVQNSGLLADGTVCDDNNLLTFNDIYTNGICNGVVNGISCETDTIVNGSYLNGNCQGGISVIKASNGKLYSGYMPNALNYNDAKQVCINIGMRLPHVNEISRSIVSEANRDIGLQYGFIPAPDGLAKEVEVNKLTWSIDLLRVLNGSPRYGSFSASGVLGNAAYYYTKNFFCVK